jgi:hypothetical protein
MLAVVPAWAVVGFMLSSVGTPARTLNPPVMVAVVPLVVTETFREPMVAVGLMVMLATADVEPLTVSELTVMPAPKLAVLLPCTKFVNRPVIVTVAIVEPCVPVGGDTD